MSDHDGGYGAIGQQVSMLYVEVDLSSVGAADPRTLGGGRRCWCGQVWVGPCVGVGRGCGQLGVGVAGVCVVV